MRLRLFPVVMFVAMIFVPSFVLAAPLKNSLEISGWIPYWREDNGVADVLPRLESLTTIHPFGYIVSNDGVVTDAMGVSDEPWKSLLDAARAKKVRIIPTIMWSDSASIHRILSDSSTRVALEDSIASLATVENFDGIDIDFENKMAETKPFFSLFLKGLYQRMGKKWLYCTIESRTPLSSRYEGTPPKDATMYSNDFVQINKYCDRVQIMAYDQGTIDVKLNAAAKGPYVPVSDPLWAEKVMKLISQTVSKKKLVLGIPTYGYEYAVTPLSIQGYSYDLLWSFNPRYALERAALSGITPERNTAGELSFTYIPTTTPAIAGVPTAAAAAGPATATVQPFNIMWWSDSIAIAQKIGIAKKLGLRGVALFKFDGGEDQALWDVLK